MQSIKLKERCSGLLFVIVAKHTADTCPGGIVRPDKRFTAKLDEQMKKSGVKVMGRLARCAGPHMVNEESD